LDTNILVYAYDISEKRRREIAKALVDEVRDSREKKGGRKKRTGWFLHSVKGDETAKKGS
jgi:hypothetical protein